jgi:hypothetical protein
VSGRCRALRSVCDSGRCQVAGSRRPCHGYTRQDSRISTGSSGVARPRCGSSSSGCAARLPRCSWGGSSSLKTGSRWVGSSRFPGASSLAAECRTRWQRPPRRPSSAPWSRASSASAAGSLRRSTPTSSISAGWGSWRRHGGADTARRSCASTCGMGRYAGSGASRSTSVRATWPRSSSTGRSGSGRSESTRFVTSR